MANKFGTLSSRFLKYEINIFLVSFQKKTERGLPPFPLETIIVRFFQSTSLSSMLYNSETLTPVSVKIINILLSRNPFMVLSQLSIILSNVIIGNRLQRLFTSIWGFQPFGLERVLPFYDFIIVFFLGCAPVDKCSDYSIGLMPTARIMAAVFHKIHIFPDQRCINLSEILNQLRIAII